VPRPPELPEPDFGRVGSAPAGELLIRAALKHVVLQQRTLLRTLDDFLRPSVPDDRREEFGPASGRPRVSVVISLYNYVSMVGDAIRSVARSDFGDFEIVVIDDASTDGSADAAATVFDEVPWV